MKRSSWITNLREQFVATLGMSEFEAGKAAELAASLAQGPWEPERVIVPRADVGAIPGTGYRLYGTELDFTEEQATCAVGILNNYEDARRAYIRIGRRQLSGGADLAALRAFFQIEEEL